eukprot:TRINITY_DN7379_c0_g1_i1.p1 TRINITY_DN7379_c0_g1~~TRINITY_DN7379_c0_g1_i1.p1  ORF type:complete len:164 (+),score=45.77 TRINITY_DN7379_c0_g1_i1:51-542(+)
MEAALDLRALPDALWEANWVAVGAEVTAVMLLAMFLYSSVWDEYWLRLARPDTYRVYQRRKENPKEWEKEEKKLHKGMPACLVSSLLATFVNVIGYHALFALAHPATLVDSILLSWFVPLVFVIPSQVADGMWKDVPVGLLVIAAADTLMSYTLTALIHHVLA